MTDKIDYTPNLKQVIPILDKALTQATNKLYETDEDRTNFILSCCINLIGNNVIALSSANLQMAESIAAQTIESLITWYDVTFARIKKMKEQH